MRQADEPDAGPDDGLLQIAEAKVRPASPDVTPISIERLTKEPADAEAEIISPTKSMHMLDPSACISDIKLYSTCKRADFRVVLT